MIEAVLDLWGPDWTFDKVVFKEAQAVYKALDATLDMSYHLKIDGTARKLTLRPWDSDEAAEAQIFAVSLAHLIVLRDHPQRWTDPLCRYSCLRLFMHQSAP